MSGHSKWAQIKRQKGAADVKRGTLYTKLAKAISLAVREGGSKDPTMNIRLRLALEKAREANMPSATIERAVKRGAGEVEGAQIERVVYEGYGPGGVAFLITTTTDNKNRSTAEVRHALESHGGSLGTNGSVQWMFSPMGVLSVTTARSEETELTLIDAGAQEVSPQEDGYRVLVPAEQMDAVRTKLEGAGLTVRDAATHLLPKTTAVVDAATREKVAALIEELEASDDVEDVTTNAAS